MLLNDVGQPILLKSNKLDAMNEMELNELSHAPFLLTGCDGADFSRLPKSWNGLLYTSTNIFKKVKAEFQLHFGQRNVKVCILSKNVATPVLLSETETLSVTMIPMDAAAKNLMFLTKDKNTQNLITNGLNGFIKVLQTNTPLRKAIIDGIDVLFIDDSIFLEQSTAEQQQCHFDVFQLRALIATVRPNLCIGLRGATLPDFIKECRLEYDSYSEPTMLMYK